MFFYPVLFLLTLPEASVTFTVPLKDTTVTENESVTLECELSKPDKKVKWYKNGKLFKPVKGVDVTAKGTVHKLTIPKSTVEDGAEYTVKFGDQSTSGTLKVEGV